MLISSGNTLTDVTQNDVLSASWASLNLRLAHNINNHPSPIHYGGARVVSDHAITQWWKWDRKHLRPEIHNPHCPSEWLGPREGGTILLHIDAWAQLQNLGWGTKHWYLVNLRARPAALQVSSSGTQHNYRPCLGKWEFQTTSIQKQQNYQLWSQGSGICIF